MKFFYLNYFKEKFNNDNKIIIYFMYTNNTYLIILLIKFYQNFQLRF